MSHSTPMHPCRIGILGLGGIGRTHARALARLRAEGVPVDVVVYSGGTSEAAASSGWPTARRTDAAEVIAAGDVDVVAVCTPSVTHAGLTVAALEAGHHVVVEKPMALTTADARRVCAVAAARGLVVSPIAQRRFEPEHRYLKRLLNEGRLGRVVLGETFVHWYRGDDYYGIAWRRDPDGGGGSLMNQGLHNVDLLCWLLGGVEEATGRTATLGHPGLAVEDTCVATLRFAGGALGVVATTTATPPGIPAELAILTTTGSLRLSQTGVKEWQFPGVPPPRTETAASGASDPSAIGIAGHVQQWRDVLEAIREGRPPAVDAADGLATTAVLDGIYTAATQGRTVRVDPAG